MRSRGQRAGFPDDLREEAERMKERLDGDERRLRRWLWAFYGLSFLPLLSALMVMTWLYWNSLGTITGWLASVVGA